MGRKDKEYAAVAMGLARDIRTGGEDLDLDKVIQRLCWLAGDLDWSIRNSPGYQFILYGDVENPGQKQRATLTRIEKLQQLIDHPETPEYERENARQRVAALRRKKPSDAADPADGVVLEPEEDLRFGWATS